ncbi:MAG: hypothetical protein ACM3JB_05720 [Acidobacteriaceae bacterium]
MRRLTVVAADGNRAFARLPRLNSIAVRRPTCVADLISDALGVEENAATGGARAVLVGAMASKPDFGRPAYRLSIQQGVSIGRRSVIGAEARKSDGVVTSVIVGGATAYISSGAIEVHRPRSSPRPSSVPQCA